jgi:hypothetical protein
MDSKHTMSKVRITIHFEKGRSFWEYVIMGVMAEKQKRLGLPVNPFSHVAVYDGIAYRYHTHPKKGVIKEEWTYQKPTPNRTKIDIEISTSRYKLLWHLWHYHKDKPFGYWSIIQQLIKHLTGVFIGREPRNIKDYRFNCATWAAFCLGIPKWWRYDIVDLQRWVGSVSQNKE